MIDHVLSGTRCDSVELDGATQCGLTGSDLGLFAFGGNGHQHTDTVHVHANENQDGMPIANLPPVSHYYGRWWNSVSRWILVGDSMGLSLVVPAPFGV